MNSEDLFDEGEKAPSAHVVSEASRLIQEAAISLDRMGYVMPPGNVSAFFGEINISWQSDDSIVRLACFENAPSLVQTGRISEPGSYRSEQNPDGALLAQRLSSLVAQNDPEPVISG